MMIGKRAYIRLFPKPFGFGLFLAVLALLYAGGLEIFRKRNNYFIQEINQDVYNASNISVFYQVPIFALLGLSEVWTSVSGFELAYTHTSDNMQGLVTGLFLMTIGLGSFYSTIWTAIVRFKTDWYPEKPVDTGHLEYYLFPISGITFILFVVYVLVFWFRRTWRTMQPFTQNDRSHDGT
ncbi:hypothetical protein CHS0354_019498 [Potamilus streckersoni]|uniref:Uncharacterized protein n=1 Tax=Potamilus streckersoni TaxID=2493646 RepID=A0AAE0SGX5_9BIVA|nr:hypothetical protein CHS0354_019498 [Potamilus streckersoni]